MKKIVKKILPVFLITMFFMVARIEPVSAAPERPTMDNNWGFTSGNSL